MKSKLRMQPKPVKKRRVSAGRAEKERDMKEKRSSGMVKSLSKWNLLSIGIGAVIGWSWVIYAGYWSVTPGTLGGILAFVVAALLCSLVGLVYAELTSAFPKIGVDVSIIPKFTNKTSHGCIVLPAGTKSASASPSTPGISSACGSVINVSGISLPYSVYTSFVTATQVCNAA